MTLVLEAIALASRPYALDELPGLKPSRPATIYFMTPENPNCVVDIFGVWEKKCAAMDALESQLLHFGKHRSEDELALAKARSLVPEWDELETDLDRGRRMKQEMDKAFYTYPHSTGHCRVMYAEPYRREGYFELSEL